jgi:hypothetical protein
MTGGIRPLRCDGEAEHKPWHEAPVADRRIVRSRMGKPSLRYVIRTALAVAGQAWPVDHYADQPRTHGPAHAHRPRGARRPRPRRPERSWLCGRPMWRSLDSAAGRACRRARVKICMLARNAKLYRIAAVRGGESARPRDPYRQHAALLHDITSHRRSCIQRRAPGGFDAVIPRIGRSVTYYGLACCASSR